ncbi:hypothetical protein C8J56DRAFT_893192 [Mycena floridula]|nr:hypothetical protein C8J56DRAFT_893192 [Mycena floridula]
MSNPILEIVHILTPGQVTAIQLSAVGAAVCASMGYGMYLIITMRAIRRGFRGSRPRWMMLAVILMMFLTTTIIFTGNIQAAVEEVVLIGAPSFSAPSIQYFDFVYLTAGALQISISNAVVVWRAWVICDRRSKSECFVVHVTSQLSHDDINNYQVATFYFQVKVLSESHYIILSWLIGQSREYERTVRTNIRHSPTSAIVHRVLMLLVQSGLVYLILWVGDNSDAHISSPLMLCQTIHTILFFIPSAIVEYYFVLAWVTYIQAMWPSVIIILVTDETHLVETTTLRHSFSVGHAQQIVVTSQFDHRKSESKSLPFSPV